MTAVLVAYRSKAYDSWRVCVALCNGGASHKFQSVKDYCISRQIPMAIASDIVEYIEGLFDCHCLSVSFIRI